MTRQLLSLGIASIAMLVATPAMAQIGPGNLPNNLFSQYTTAPGASQTTAGMYPAPHWVPHNVGHSYYTYQPLMPHEMMYQHQRNYYNYSYDNAYYGGGASLNKTSVVWQAGANHYAPLPFTRPNVAKLHYRLANRKYCLGADYGLGSWHQRGYAGGACSDGTCVEEFCE